MKKPPGSIKKVLTLLGPGFMTGASANDPSSIGTYAQAGARFGMAQAWTNVATLPLIIAIQEMCGRIGIVTHQGLTHNIISHYSKKLAYVFITLFCIATALTMGADMGIMAASASDILHLPFTIILIVLLALMVFMQLYLPYEQYAIYLKLLTLVFITYIINAFFIHLNYVSTLKETLFPTLHVTPAYLLNLLAVLGSDFSPYLFFWQTNQEIEEKIAKHKTRLTILNLQKPLSFTKKDIRWLRLDTANGMIFANLITWFVTLTSSGTLYTHHIRNITTPEQAALALQPIAGHFSTLLFSIGIVGAGLLSVPVMAGSISYAVSELFNVPAGFNMSVTQAPLFYGVIVSMTIVSGLINFIGINVFSLLIFANIIQGIAAAPILIMIILIANNKRIMKNYTNIIWNNILGVFTILLMIASSLIGIISFFLNH